MADNSQCIYFFRVNVTLMDSDPKERTTLGFDFDNGQEAIEFAEKAYLAGDLYKVTVNIIQNEVTTTESPMWRCKYD